MTASFLKSLKLNIIRIYYCMVPRAICPLVTGRKLNVHNTFRRRPGRLLNVLCTFDLRSVSTGWEVFPEFFFICNLFHDPLRE